MKTPARSICGVVAAATLLCLHAASPAWAQPDRGPDPEAVARRCAQHITATAERCTTLNQRFAERAAETIGKLLENGNDAAAQKLARQTARRVSANSDRCAKLVRQDCRRCRVRLHRLGADPLAERLEGVCEDQLETIRRSQARALRTLREALGQAPAEPPAE